MNLMGFMFERRACTRPEMTSTFALLRGGKELMDNAGMKGQV